MAHFGTVIFVLAAILLLPVCATLVLGLYALTADGSERPTRWLGSSRTLVVLTTVALWWVFWDLLGVPALASTDPNQRDYFSFFETILFCSLPSASAFVSSLIVRRFDRIILGLKYSLSEKLLLSFWGTVSFTIPLLLSAAAFEALLRRSLLGFAFLLIAAVAQLLGTAMFRIAAELKPRRVKSGLVYKRAFVLAQKVNVPLKFVCVVPTGRGHLTNAYASPRTIAITENYGTLFSGPQLDFVIGHELGHARAGHFWKQTGTMVVIFVGLGLACYFPASIPATLRVPLQVTLVFLPTLIARFLSRRFEHEADHAGLLLTGNREAAVQALIKLDASSPGSPRGSRWTEPFLTHPPLNKRIRALSESPTDPE